MKNQQKKISINGMTLIIRERDRKKKKRKTLLVKQMYSFPAYRISLFSLKPD